MPEFGWGLLVHQKSSNRSRNMGSNAHNVNRGLSAYHRFCLVPFFFKFYTLNVEGTSPKFHRLFRTYLSLFWAFENMKTVQTGPKIWVRMCILRSVSGHFVHSNPYFWTCLSFFDALKGPNQTWACPEQYVKFW